MTSYFWKWKVACTVCKRKSIFSDIIWQLLIKRGTGKCPMGVYMRYLHAALNIWSKNCFSEPTWFAIHSNSIEFLVLVLPLNVWSGNGKIERKKGELILHYYHKKVKVQFTESSFLCPRHKNKHFGALFFITRRWVSVVKKKSPQGCILLWCGVVYRGKICLKNWLHY